MKKNIGLYLAVGLVVLLAIIILIFGLFFLNDKDPREVFDTYYLRFPQVSTLTLDDPVKINGVKLGKVEDIYLSGHRVLVVVRIRNDVRIPVGSEIRVQNIGIMGERQIGIILCDSSENYSPNDTIDGQFDAGIAEALGLAGEIIDSTKTLITSVHQVMDSTIANPEFRTKFRTMMDKAENLEDRLAKMLKDTDPQIKSSLNNLNMATVKVNALLDTVKAPVSGLLADANNLMQDAGGILVKLDSVTNRLTLLTSKLQSTDNTAGILLNDRTLHDDLVQTLHSADSLFQIILQDGLDINVDFF
ncbi:MlaD family protein [Fibrobacter intestinalis]|uniref:Phospholipid/cholesterol/gamma-HCH transport system substrate-binding protein n=1 Tax=Fibrobacter intestinalis TaxID=28122 RepID=A0A1T4K623_9BACT|nr:MULTISPECIES: MlaD family protein [Fibrobacter]PBC74305.1 phospholipid/cholesterol/gamma-HCH transport system substrate-binding protein [Fibrobacter sp. NR9]SJZ37866.1 phospholipid/cholesterol/gamma-HCH transport system substrate-binding protein [Fibrobacter intestinalis]